MNELMIDCSFHGDDYEKFCLPRCDTVSGGSLKEFQRNVLSSLGSTCKKSKNPRRSN
jgi:hypothetical protein